MAYVAITSLKQTIDQLIMNWKLEFTFDEVNQFKTLSEKISVVQEMLQYSADKCDDHKKMKHLEGCIRDMAHRAEDFIEEFVYIKAEASDMAAIFEELDLQCHMLEFFNETNSIQNRLRKIYQESDAAAIKVQEAGTHSVEHSSGWSSNPEETHVVGIDNDLLKIKERLTGLPSKLDILTIVGMGGIGKTTLARKVFNDRFIEYHFYIRAWVTVSQKYVLRDVLLGLLSSLTKLADEIFKEKNEQLAELLYRNLKGQRYLIVMDAVWDEKIWYDLKRSFPDDKNGSRIVMTSRLIDVGMCVNLDSHPHHMSFLSLNDSWELLRNKVFLKESCPSELEVMGKKIAQKCHGLPLSILAVAGHLSSLSKTVDCWTSVADGIQSLDLKDQENCLDILGLSYKSLPHHLKACFLYLGVFPPDFEIPVWRLIRLWVAEGILRAECQKSLEEVAESCLQELISRTLVMVRKRKSDGGIKSCGVHDLMRDLIFREVEKEDFLLVLKSDANSFPRDAYDKRRLCFHHQIGRSYVMKKTSRNVDHHAHMMPSILRNRSILFYGRLQVTEFNKMLDSHVTVTDFKLLRVLEILFRFFEHFPVEITQLVHLRYLAFSVSTYFPTCLSQLWNLQTLINEHYRNVTLPNDIWKMPQLRHLYLKNGGCLPHPVGAKAIENNSLVLPNLEKLSTVSFASCHRDVFSCLPNLKKLGIRVMQFKSFPLHNCLDDLLYLSELEKLKCVFLERDQVSHWKAFPPKLRKLTLGGSCLPWEKMRTLGMLPNLEVLKLKDYAFQGPEWEVAEDEFCQLKYLLIDGTDLVHWGVTGIHFQRLEQLILRGCRHLNEIPSEVGEIPTLQIIDLDDSSTLAVSSARLIQQEQYSMGNDDLIVRIHHSDP